MAIASSLVIRDLPSRRIVARRANGSHLRQPLNEIVRQLARLIFSQEGHWGPCRRSARRMML